ncbi:MAG: hypothetical protein OEO23_12545 [Gemmatimonadota bacterium]|nr:hypothetical protein [Gemmatimonadota bacterium]
MITTAGFARFYAPLAATSLLLTATNPILAAALARSADPTIALAGYSVAFAVCGVLYAPLLVVQQVAAARLLSRGSFSPVRRFAYLMGAVFSLIGALIAYTALGDVVFARLVGVGPAVLAEALRAMAFLWPVPFLTAVRAAHQGRLVAGHKTKPIASATGVRTGILAVVAFGLATTGGGAWLGAIAFTVGLAMETLIVMLAPTPNVVLEHEDCTTNQQDIARFSAPLMVNVLLWWATPLIINAVLARTTNPDPSLAAFAVVEAFAWFVTAPVGQLQHASIALVQCSETHKRVRAWGAALAAVMSGILLFFAIPAVRAFVFRSVFALEPELMALAGAALPIAAAYPFLYGLRQYYQGLFVRSGRTIVVGVGAVLRVTAVLIAAFLCVHEMGHQGAVLGVGLSVFGLTVEGLFLERMSQRKVMPELRTTESTATPFTEAFEGASEA